jgi:hypothetical protein
MLTETPTIAIDNVFYTFLMSILSIAPPDIDVIDMDRSANAPMVVATTKEQEFAEGGRFIVNEECINGSVELKESVLTKESVSIKVTAGDIIKNSLSVSLSVTVHIKSMEKDAIMSVKRSELDPIL